MKTIEDNGKLFCIIVSAVFVLLNYLTPITLSDDILYHCIWQLDETAPKLPLESVSDLITSQLNHYQVVNGRVWIHTLLQLFAGFLGKGLYNVVQGVVCYAFVRMMARYVAKTKPTLWHVVLVVLALFVFLPGFAGAYLFFCAGINYLWVSLVVITFLYRFERSDNKGFSFLTAALAFLAGWSHEGIALPLALAFVVYLFVHRTAAFKGSHTVYIAIFLLGTALCIYPPLTIDRAGIGQIGTEGFLKQRLLSALSLLQKGHLVYVLPLTLAYLFVRHRTFFKSWIRSQWFLLVAFTGAFGIAMLSGFPESRTLYYSEWIASLLLFNLVLRLKVRRKAVAVTAMCGVMLFFLVPTLVLSVENHNNYEDMLAQCRKPKNTTVWVRQIAKPKNVFMGYIFTNYVRESVRFGRFELAQGWDTKNEYVRSAAMLFHKPELCFLPASLRSALDIVNPIKPIKPVKSENAELMAVQLPNAVLPSSVWLELKKERTNEMSFKDKLFSYPSCEYPIEKGKYGVVRLHNRHYLLLCLPSMNIQKRIKNVRWK